MSLPLSESSVKTVDTGRVIAATGAAVDEKLREARPQEDDTLSSILLMLKSNTNDDDDDVAAADLETLANVIGDDTDISGLPMVSNDGTTSSHGYASNSHNNGNDVTFATAVQTHIDRMGSNVDHKFVIVNDNLSSIGSNGTIGGMNNSSVISSGSQKSSISRNIKIDDLRSYFHLPIVEVAKQLGICTTLLKRVCRTNKIKKWPYRQIRSIAKSIQSLEMSSMNGLLPEAERDKSQEQITFLKRSLEALIDDPSIPIDAAVEMAMRTVAEDGTLLDFIPNADLISDSDPLLKPTPAQVIAASVASSNIDRVIPNSKPRPPKRKKSDVSGTSPGCGTGVTIDLGVNRGFDENCNLSDPAMNESGDSSFGFLPCLILGDSIVNQSIWNDGGKQRVTYLPPVQLTPLIRKKAHNPSKKLVPLIEPDICNCFQMDFLPLPLLRLSEIANQSSEVVPAFIMSNTIEINRNDRCHVNVNSSNHTNGDVNVNGHLQIDDVGSIESQNYHDDMNNISRRDYVKDSLDSTVNQNTLSTTTQFSFSSSTPSSVAVTIVPPYIEMESGSGSVNGSMYADIRSHSESMIEDRSSSTSSPSSSSPFCAATSSSFSLSSTQQNNQHHHQPNKQPDYRLIFTPSLRPAYKDSVSEEDEREIKGNFNNPTLSQITNT